MAEAAAEKSANAMECPVCSEDYTNPKLLDCNHLVCHKCIVDWLEKTNRAGGCPLCRSPILPGSLSGHEDLQTLVDALPTDLTTVSHVEGSKILKGRNVCMQCSTSSAASSFCLQCRMKLCTACVKAHKNIPMLKNHVIENLSDLTPERLATSRSYCKSHDDVLTEMYCLVHRELVCMRCAITTHKHCTGVKPIEDAAQARREGLKKEARQLREKERAITAKMEEKNHMLMTMRQRTKDTFDGLRELLEKKRHEVNTEIKNIEDHMALPKLENDRMTAKGNADKVDNLADSASDQVLLEMSDKLRPRLTGLQQRMAGVDEPDDALEMVFDFQALSNLRASLDSFWTIKHDKPSCRLQSTDQASGATSVGSNPDPTGTTTPVRAELSARTKALRDSLVLVKTLKVGDRVRRGRDWNSGYEDGNGQGTVIAVPSEIRTKQNCDSEHYVDVRWKNGRERCYRMGRYNRYDLKPIA